MANNIKNKFLSGVIWTSFQNVIVKALTFLIGIILARILSPEDFGLVGMLSIFFTISQVFIESGFGQALVQKKDCNEEDFSTAFYFNVAVSIVIYLSLFLSSPYIARYYHEPQLEIITKVAALNFVLGSINVVQRAKLQKALSFRPLAIIHIIGTISGGIIAIALAALGFGVWALVAQTITNTICAVILFPYFSKWIPTKRFSIGSFRHLWNYGSKILASGILAAIVRNFANIIIGRYYNKEQVGYYSRAYTSAELPAKMMLDILYNVSFPVFSEVQNEEERVCAIFQKILFLTMLTVTPPIILLSLVARPLVIVLLTEKWLPSVPFLQVLLLARMFMPLSAIHEGIIGALGHSDVLLRLSIICGLLSIVSIIVAIPFGVHAMAFATLIAAILSYIITSSISKRFTGYSLYEQMKDFWKIMLCLGLMSVVTIFVESVISNPLLQLFGGLVAGGLVYIVLGLAFSIIDKTVFATLFGVVRQKIHR